MSYRVHITTEAGEDIKDIYDYTEENIDKQTAIDQNKKIREIINTLSEFPNRHQKYEFNDPELLKRNLHGFPLGRYMVLYDVDEANHIVTISRIIHGARDIEALLHETK